MIRPFARGITALALVLLYAGSAFADEIVDGDGFRVAIPAGFSRLPASECGT